MDHATSLQLIPKTEQEEALERAVVPRRRFSEKEMFSCRGLGRRNMKVCSMLC